MVLAVRKRLVLLAVAGAILILLVVYPMFQCSVDRSQIQVTLVRPWEVSRLEGYAVGFDLNVTNYSNCDLNLESVTVTVHTATYRNGTAEALEFTETQPTATTISHASIEEVGFTFDYIFPSYPTRLNVSVEMSFRETGPIAVFDGEVEIPYRG